MERVKALIVEGLQSILDLARSTKEAYDGASRFARMRLMILAIFLVDVVAVFLFIGTFGSRALEVTVWYEKSFPSNMLIIRNESGDALEDVRLTLDGKYTLTVPRLEPGVRGFEVGRDFLDASEFTPDDGYQPRAVKVEADGETMTLDISLKPSR